jgi:hypothetical protein
MELAPTRASAAPGAPAGGPATRVDWSELACLGDGEEPGDARAAELVRAAELARARWRRVAERGES